ncbi:MAG: ABC transporter substrate-binding protein, partial [Pseudomonadota bacterium]
MKMKAFALTFGAMFAATTAMADEIVLRGVSCFPIGSPPSVPFEQMVEEINARGEGVVQIELLGGAPAIGSPFQVADRMALGAYDIAGCPESYFGSLVPEAPALRLH